MLKHYLNQTALRQKSTGVDDRGQLVYGAAATVPCRLSEKTQTLMSADGRMVVAQRVYYLTTPVAEGDMLDGKIVLAVAQWADLGGHIIGYKAVI